MLSPRPNPRLRPPLSPRPNPRLMPRPDTTDTVIPDTVTDTDTSASVPLTPKLTTVMDTDANTDTVDTDTVDTVVTDTAVMVTMVNFAQSDQVTRISKPRKSG